MSKLYRYTTTEGVYEFTLEDDLRGIGEYSDRIVFDRISGKGYIERNIAKIVFDGTENWGFMTPHFFYTPSKPRMISGSPLLCSHYRTSVNLYEEGSVSSARGARASYWVLDSRFKGIVSDFKDWISSQNLMGNPVIGYHVIESPIHTPLTFTKVYTSSATEVPLSFIETTHSLEFPAEVYDMEEGTIISHGKNLVSIPEFKLGYSFCGGGYGYYVSESVQPAYAYIDIPLKGNTKYTFSISDNTIYWLDRVAELDSEGICTYNLADYSLGNHYSKVTRLTHINTTHAFFRIRRIDGAYLTQSDLENIQLQVEEGETATEYIRGYSPTLINLPVLRKIGEVRDTFNPKTGEHVKRISDWVNITNTPTNMTSSSSSQPKIKKCFFSGLIPNYIRTVNNPLGLKHDSKRLSSDLGEADGITISGGWGGVAVSVSHEDSGWNDAITSKNGLLTPDEIKAYFYGYRMCNADKTSPYYKSEIPYNPVTWEEWVLVSGVTTDITGMTHTSDGSTWTGSYININAKPNTKYGLLCNIIENTLNGQLTIRSTSINDGLWFTIPKETIGNFKRIDSSGEQITGSKIQMYISSNLAPIGEKIKFKDIRIFELPIGSQIETDFETLTPDELNAKYTFNGLCVKHWKKLVGDQSDIDASLTSILPTTSYDGYTPYKMIYQLAEPVVTQLDPAPMPTYYPTTFFDADSPIAVPRMDIIMKVED